MRWRRLGCFRRAILPADLGKKRALLYRQLIVLVIFFFFLFFFLQTTIGPEIAGVIASTRRFAALLSAPRFPHAKHIQSAEAHPPPPSKRRRIHGNAGTASCCDSAIWIGPSSSVPPLAANTADSRTFLRHLAPVSRFHREPWARARAAPLMILGCVRSDVAGSREDAALLACPGLPWPALAGCLPEAIGTAVSALLVQPRAHSAHLYINCDASPRPPAY